MKRVILIVITILLVVSCNQDNTYEFEPEPNILALMRTWERSQLIIVDESFDITDTVNVWGVRGAFVRITSGNNTYTFIDSFFDSDSGYWRKYDEGFYFDSLYPELNDTTLYRLEVILPQGDTVTAQAYMPSPVRISSPSDSDTVHISQEPYNPHTVSWNSCKNTSLYMIYCIPDVDTSQFYLYSDFLFLPSVTADTVYNFFLERMLIPWVFDMHYVLRVIAVSPEYLNYAGTNMAGSISNLSQGYGMFGGISEDAKKVFLME